MNILLNLMMLLLGLYAEIRGKNQMLKWTKEKGQRIAIFLPLFSMVIAFGVEGNDDGSDNELLNTARHTFRCSMRFVLPFPSLFPVSRT